MQRLKCPFTIAAVILLCVFVYLFTAHRDDVQQWLLPQAAQVDMSQHANSDSSAIKPHAD
ncbi:hypothetical protein JYB87_03255 [Shewanella avicenniae]|uniref:Uncharacterized protein n=1 Tax=Shewanella avicenniae TaxID=2814294 RepID=A0ABX7QUH0_9GAMM|nr:hypothetical protein [Shewanella avicenniae]QSX34283.1 hypothetical protein JYB87_03255 [Shewanella avicenniae]